MGAGRLLALDRLRGLVMVLMAIDHAGASMDGTHFATDSALLWSPGGEIPGAAFLTRWITHFCAPTFVFLAGVSMALSRHARSRQAPGQTAAQRAVDWFNVKRGLFIAALDPLLISVLWLMVGQDMLALQVLYAIGLAMVAMVFLRRLPAVVVVALGALYLVGSEWLVTQTVGALNWGAPLWSGLLQAPFYWPDALELGGESFAVANVYPLLPWLAMMMLGWAFGRRLLKLRRAERSAVPTLLGCGLAGLALFALVRGLNGYGNMFLLRDDSSWAHWLHVSKYPPSLSYTALTLGGMALGLAGLLRLEERGVLKAGSGNGPLVVLGQTAMFFYVAHFVLILGFARLSGMATGLGEEGGGLASAWWGGLGASALLYFPCRAYRTWKRAQPDGWARYV